jgi:hypothetical protein
MLRCNCHRLEPVRHEGDTLGPISEITVKWGLNSQKGPPSLGNPVSCTLKITPVPSYLREHRWSPPHFLHQGKRLC